MEAIAIRICHNSGDSIVVRIAYNLSNNALFGSQTAYEILEVGRGVGIEKSDHVFIVYIQYVREFIDSAPGTTRASKDGG